MHRGKGSRRVKVAYVHNLPLEYYPPATNFLTAISDRPGVEVRAYTTHNQKRRPQYQNTAVKTYRSRPPDPHAAGFLRLLVGCWWHIRTALSLALFRPDAIVYVEPHSAIAAYLYYRMLGGSAAMHIHHHEYYEDQDYRRAGMRLPQLGCRLERSYLFHHADWISHTNDDRLRLAQRDNPGVASSVWHVLPNYPPQDWARKLEQRRPADASAPLRLVYIGSASFEDTYVEEIVRWAASRAGTVELHLCGYNVAQNVWDWIEREGFSNVTIEPQGCAYANLPQVLAGYDVGLVLYKGSTTNFIYNVPNKVFEYLVCGLEVWYPKEMLGIRKFGMAGPGIVRELDFSRLDQWEMSHATGESRGAMVGGRYTAERAFAPLFGSLGLN